MTATTQKRPLLRVGTSGYQYDHWREVFYPSHMPKSQWFSHYTKTFDTVELNNTFYRLPAEHTLKMWHDQAPQGFSFAVKYSRYGSHMKHLKDPEQHLPPFSDRIKRLGTRLGPILLQLPPAWRVNAERLDHFLEAAPKALRWAVEFRHPSWLCDEIYAVLRSKKAALCIHDMMPHHPEIMTVNWTYLRFHGAGTTGNYTRKKLEARATKIRAYLTKGISVYAYFNNDVRGFAPANAKKLRELVGETQQKDVEA